MEKVRECGVMLSRDDERKDGIEVRDDEYG
jgi:hypothetical protein